jgi:hypothetical protein
MNNSLIDTLVSRGPKSPDWSREVGSPVFNSMSGKDARCKAVNLQYFRGLALLRLKYFQYLTRNIP